MAQWIRALTEQEQGTEFKLPRSGHITLAPQGVKAERNAGALLAASLVQKNKMGVIRERRATQLSTDTFTTCVLKQTEKKRGLALDIGKGMGEGLGTAKKIEGEQTQGVRHLGKYDDDGLYQAGVGTSFPPRMHGRLGLYQQTEPRALLCLAQAWPQLIGLSSRSSASLLLILHPWPRLPAVCLGPFPPSPDDCIPCLSAV